MKNIKKVSVTNPNYFVSSDAAWKYYNRNIAYQCAPTECELVMLRGNYEGKVAIKIPADLNSFDYRKRLEDLHNIVIYNRRIFTSCFSLFGEEVDYDVHLYMVRG